MHGAGRAGPCCPVAECESSPAHEEISQCFWFFPDFWDFPYFSWVFVGFRGFSRIFMDFPDFRGCPYEISYGRGQKIAPYEISYGRYEISYRCAHTGCYFLLCFAALLRLWACLACWALLGAVFLCSEGFEPVTFGALRLPRHRPLPTPPSLLISYEYCL